MTPYPHTIGQLIRSIRAGRTQTAMAAALGTSQSLICQWEKGRRSPSARSVGKLLELASVEDAAALLALAFGGAAGRARNGRANGVTAGK